MIDVKDLYPAYYEEDYWSAPGDYTPLLQAFGGVLLRVDDHDYQGDSRLLYAPLAGRYGLLIFGWGSCSGCDALQGCNSHQDLQDLADHLESQILWKTRTEMIAYFKEHDWEGDYSCHAPETQRFIRLALALLEEQ